MKVFSTSKELQEFLQGKTNVGFVPTMGALHKGHLSLINHSKSACNITICSIYVNPTQFNNVSDLKNYPRFIDEDLIMLEKAGCDVVFIPNDEEIYSGDFQKLTIPLGNLEEILEGKYRPGHFAGVITVVKKLFDIVKPQKAFFGQKDYQQLMVIEKMVTHFKLPIMIVPCEILREAEGLAMSSRNMLLNQAERTEALNIYKALKIGKSLFEKGEDLPQIKIDAEKAINNSALQLEYLEFADADSLQIVSQKNNSSIKIVCLVAAYCGKVRLIDNMFLN